jgi:hypothetical protein
MTLKFMFDEYIERFVVIRSSGGLFDSNEPLGYIRTPFLLFLLSSSVMDIFHSGYSVLFSQGFISVAVTSR